MSWPDPAIPLQPSARARLCEHREHRQGKGESCGSQTHSQARSHAHAEKHKPRGIGWDIPTDTRISQRSDFQKSPVSQCTSFCGCIAITTSPHCSQTTPGARSFSRQVQECSWSLPSLPAAQHWAWLSEADRDTPSGCGRVCPLAARIPGSLFFKASEGERPQHGSSQRRTQVPATPVLAGEGPCGRGPQEGAGH